jgi:dissimilatory sulfite reductase (desulfoviridin) alpha/beta subunit
VPTIDESALKGGGFIKLRPAGEYAVRVKILVGDATAEQLRAVTEVAERYGDGTVHLTVRQCIEVPYVHLEDFGPITARLAEVGLGPGACGPRVRVPVCCPGSTLCPRGLNDTKTLAKALDAELYGGGEIPHKFKVGVTGCSSSCAKPQENDLGYMGAVEPAFEPDACIACGLCAETCPVGAISLDADGHPVIDTVLCRHDGKCIGVCPSGALRAGRTGWRVFVGGRFGAEPKLGVELVPFIGGDEALPLARRVLGAYVALADKRERLGVMIDRIGLDAFKERVLTDE